MNKFKKIATMSAVAVNLGPGGGIDNRFNTLAGLTPQSLLVLGVNVLLGSAGIIAFFMLLWGGVQWILSGGDKEGVEKARKRITGALIGLAIVFSAYALLYIVTQLFGINNALQLNLGNLV